MTDQEMYWKVKKESADYFMEVIRYVMPTGNPENEDQLRIYRALKNLHGMVSDLNFMRSDRAKAFKELAKQFERGEIDE
jgi:hypothetical protein